MKKLFSLLLAAVMMLVLAACGKNNMTETTDIGNSEVVSGGWGMVESPVVTDDLKAVVKKASDAVDDTNYIPVAYLSSQVVAGTNHLVLCKTEPVSGDGASFYALVTIYEDLDGNAEITAVAQSVMEAPAEGLTGGWTESGTLEVTAQAKDAFDRAKQAFDTDTYEPIALLSTQIVSGANYALLCEASPNHRGSAANYAIVTVYEDLGGSAVITGIYGFTADHAVPTAPAAAD